MNPATRGSLSAALKAQTAPLHALAERSGAMADLLAGRLSLPGYCALLRNLQLVYAALEAGLDQHEVDARLWHPALRRLEALAQDLAQLQPGARPVDLTLVPTAKVYASHLAALSEQQPGLLLAHAYVRYLGDLHGGQMLSKLIRRHYGLEGSTGTAFYWFGEPAQVEALKLEFRSGLDGLALSAPQLEAFVEEACEAFRLHQRLFEELHAQETGPLTAAPTVTAA